MDGTTTATRYVPAPPAAVTPFMLRSFMAGALDMSAFPAFLVSQIKATAARIERQHQRAVKRETKAQHYAAVGLNGPRAVARRLRQIEAGRLRASNGVAAVAS